MDPSIVRHGSANNWWLRSMNLNNTNNFYNVNNTGDWNNNNASNNNLPAAGFHLCENYVRVSPQAETIFAKDRCEGGAFRS